MNGKNAVILLVLAVLWIGGAIHRYPKVKEQGELANQQRIAAYGNTPINVRRVLTKMPTDGEVVPSFRQLLIWPLRNKVTCRVEVDGQVWDTFVVDTTDVP